MELNLLLETYVTTSLDEEIESVSLNNYKYWCDPAIDMLDIDDVIEYPRNYYGTESY